MLGFKNKILDDMYRIFIVLLTSTMLSLSIIWFLGPANIYSGGIGGISQILTKLFEPIANIPIGVFNLILNIPVLFFGFKMLSKRFAIYSLLSVLTQTVLLLGFIPVVDFGLNPQTDRLTLTIIGGLFCGLASGIALRAGTSTGGFDVIAQIFAIHKNLSVGFISTIVNVAIAIIGGLIIPSGGFASMFNTFIRIIITSIVIDKIHTIYNYTKLSIITNNLQSTLDELVRLNKSCTIIEGYGGFTKKKKYDLIVVVSAYETQEVIEVCKRHDPEVFIIVEPIKNIYGNYKRKILL